MSLASHAAAHLSALPNATATRYLIATFLSVCITIGLPIILVEFGSLGASKATALALSLALAVNFLSMKLFVYRNDGSWQAQAVRFLIAASLFRLGEYAGFLALYGILDLFYVLALGVTVGLSFVAKFFTYHLFVFSARPQDKHVP
jgi:putative flippase GtrA